MIAVLIEGRCTGCNACVAACPAFVFDTARPHPVIARIGACQTCYLCELACNEDALWVNPDQASAKAPPPDVLLRSGQLGQIRRDHGWDNPLDAGQLDTYRLLGPLLNEGAHIAERRYLPAR